MPFMNLLNSFARLTLSNGLILHHWRLIRISCVGSFHGLVSLHILLRQVDNADIFPFYTYSYLIPVIDSFAYGLLIFIYTQVEEAAIAALKRALSALNIHLASNTYLVGHTVTLADIIMTCNLTLGFSRIMTKNFTSEFPHVERYFWTMVNIPTFHKILGEIKQAESIPPVQSAKKPAPSKSKPDEPKKEAKKEPAKPREEASPEEEAPKPKPKNPLDFLPPSKMILDDWKRLYSNTKTNFREVAIKGILYS